MPFVEVAMNYKKRHAKYVTVKFLQKMNLPRPNAHSESGHRKYHGGN
jgi:hypothetical protein